MLQEVWDQQEMCGLFALVVVLGSSSEQWLCWQGEVLLWLVLYGFGGTEGDRSHLSLAGKKNLVCCFASVL